MRRPFLHFEERKYNSKALQISLLPLFEDQNENSNDQTK
jgi:hypothetical protein